MGGGSALAVRVELNPGLMASYGIGFDDVRAAITSSNVNIPKGRIENGNAVWEIRTNDQIYTAEHYKPLTVAYRAGKPINLRDIADVRDSVEDLRTIGLVNGKPAVPVILFRQPGANIIATVDRVLGITSATYGVPPRQGEGYRGHGQVHHHPGIDAGRGTDINHFRHPGNLRGFRISP